MLTSRSGLIADVTYGFSFNGVPGSNGDLAGMLATEGYNSSLPFYWNSRLFSGQVKLSLVGNELYLQIRATGQLACSHLGANDVIDVQLIAHSRGTAVIGQAMKTWWTAWPNQ